MGFRPLVVSVALLIVAASVVATTGLALVSLSAKPPSVGQSTAPADPSPSLRSSLSSPLGTTELASPPVAAPTNTQSSTDAGPVDNTSWWIEFGTDTIGTGGPTVTTDYLVEVVDAPTTLRVRDRDDGSPYGTFDTGSDYRGIVGSAAVHDGVAYFGIGRTLYAVSLSDMTELWNTTFEHRAIWSTPTFDDGVVYTGAGDAYAVHASNGSVKWRFDVGNYRLDRQPAVVNDRVYLVDDVGEMHVVEADTGAALWNVSAATGNTKPNSQPVVSDGDVYVALAGTLYRLNQDGSTVWTHELTAPSAGIAVDGDRVYASNADGTLEAVDVGAGTRSWTYTDPDGGGFVNDQKGAPFVTGNGLVYASVTHFSTRNGSLVALDAENGTETWRFDSGSMFGDDVAYRGNVVYVNNGTGVQVFDGPTS